MSYLALYRKYRPTTFADVIGQDHIVRALSNQVALGQIGHAYLFTGSRGTGKTSCAKIFAKAINCEKNINGSPCYMCETCKSLANASNMDILEIDAASNNRVDEIRELRDKVAFPPVSSKYKVYIIDEVHMLTDSAFNALLKTLEEPPKHAVFILATTEAHKLPQTILSRCMRFDFKLVDTEVLKNHVLNVFKQENIACEEEAAKAIAVAGEGSVRDTLSIADCISAYCNGNVKLSDVLEVLGINERQSLLKFAAAFRDKSIGEALVQVDLAYNGGKNMAVFARDVAGLFRDLLVAKTCTNPNEILNLPTDLFEQYKEMSQSFDVKTMLLLMKIFSSILSELKYALSPRVLVETACVMALENEEDLKELKKN
ncbi:MAG: DNA polymerase III subunit gamma/tau [Clostridia bacterium]